MSDILTSLTTHHQSVILMYRKACSLASNTPTHPPFSLSLHPPMYITKTSTDLHCMRENNNNIIIPDSCGGDGIVNDEKPAHVHTPRNDKL